ncbi:adenosylcobinamide-phosphate synthase CbiB [Thiomicrospira sp. R3]|uniref:adenosylcobinamide-phosphate synthase CbiB n=1 Tax=Thiomicrospira sp. R3 TaxID=3035472 RepID=UPI00259B238E|nr:adenosylcobinamide-phosphate synthase CbiB [Thiomicrospira sp. R3]WFE68190.1 adenosylcobinamide-phosphate synthase CbiB [Thiomicrospira sp. R3]
MLLFDPVWILLVALFGLLIDRWVGEFLNRTHPVVGIGKLISGFEKRFYRDHIRNGAWLVLWVLVCCGVLASIAQGFLNGLALWLSLLLGSVLASIFFAHRMLYDSVHALLNNPEPQQPLAMLVSRDTADLTPSECYKAGIETYAENLSDGVVAPLFYFLLLGLPGLVVYKAINTLDSMVGYRTVRYERFGKVAARLDDIVNWIPARLTALLIMLVGRQGQLKHIWQQARDHASPNAGYPISAMAWVIKAQLGGPTRYFGELKAKPYFGHPQDPRSVGTCHLSAALGYRTAIDFCLVLIILIGLVFYVV